MAKRRTLCSKMSVWVQKLSEIFIYIIMFIDTKTNTDIVVMGVYCATYIRRSSNRFAAKKNAFGFRVILASSQLSKYLSVTCYLRADTQ